MGDDTDIFELGQPRPATEPFTPPYVTTPVRPRRDRTRVALIFTTCLLVLALGAGSAAYVYTNNSAREWKATAERLSSELTTAARLRDEAQANLDRSQAALATTKAALEDVTKQYNAAADRVRTLADEKAQSEDDVGVLGTVVQRSRNVSVQLDQCVAGLQELQQYLVGIDGYDRTEVLRVAGQVNQGCDEAQAASDAFVQWLEGD